jgi:hypothetical protein
MKKELLLVTALAAGFLLAFATVAFAAHTGVMGKLWDNADPATTWEYGAQIVAAECNAAGDMSGEYYGCDNADVTGTFSFTWGTENCADVSGGMDTPGSGDYVCLYIMWGDGPAGTPSDTQTDPKPYIQFVTRHMDFGNIQSGTGANAVTLTDVAAQSPGQWVLITLAIVALVGVGGVVLLLRRRRIA